jgi:patatin-related protein
MSNQVPVDYQLETEVRFAVVMYGGVSLAIYINGVTQELFHMVRATAMRKVDEAYYFVVPDEKLEGTEVQYRELGRRLKARFVVDILSGTSAGGINSVFLAKALANQETIQKLQQLWVDEGDINLLINDKNSLEDLGGLKLQPELRSMLNSRRMYFELLKAISSMEADEFRDEPARGPFHSPYVDELDLYVTATDIRGLTLPVGPSSSGQLENVHRAVFRFHYSEEEAAGQDSNDFTEKDIPFLAFAARCTSSFPFAFEPMRLEDIKDVLQVPPFAGRFNYKDKDQWSRFYKDYQEAGADFEKRSFGDGGYLDNKPFSYVTETLLRRRADLPIQRKLVYIDPAPEHPEENSAQADERPNVVEDVLSALVFLPRYETIRGDLQLVEARNAVIERLDQTLDHMDSILQKAGKVSGKIFSKRPVAYWQASGHAWAQKYLDYSLNHYGVAYAYYHQLRVAEVLENLAVALARVLGWEENGAKIDKLRSALAAWRKARYAIQSNEEGKRSENDLLYRLDMSFRMRRLHFMQNLINRLLEALKPDCPPEKRQAAQQLMKISHGSYNFEKVSSSEDERNFDAGVLLGLKQNFNDAYVDLRMAGRTVRSRSLCQKLEGADPDLKAYVEAVQRLADLLEANDPDDEVVIQTVEDLSLALHSHPDPDSRASGYFFKIRNDASRSSRVGLAPDLQRDQWKVAQRRQESHLKDCLNFFYQRYEYYDMITYPVIYGTPVGESDRVDILRVSPEDALGLVKDKNAARHKLKGTKLGSFGAFFAREWRQNDMLWGRLDGVECLVNALWPKRENESKAEKQERDDFIRGAHQQILADDLLPTLQEQVFQKFNQATLKNSEKALVSEKVNSVLALIKQPDRKELLAYFQTGYAVNDKFPPEPTINLAARSVNVLGKMFKGLSDKYKALDTPAAWLTRAGQVFSQVLRLSLPDSLPGSFFRRWLLFIYPLEILMALLGTPLGFKVLSQFGYLAFLVTLGVHLAVLMTGSLIRGKTWPIILLRLVLQLLIVVLALAAAGLIYFGLVKLSVLAEPSGALHSLMVWLQSLFAE